MNEVKKLDETDPLIATLFMDVSNRRYDRFNVKQIIELKNDIIFIPYRTNIGRNEKCWCKSNSKYKHCHGREE